MQARTNETDNSSTPEITNELPLSWRSEDLEALQQARDLLETPGLAIKMTNLIGTPIEKGLKYLPADWSEQIEKITVKILLNSLIVPGIHYYCFHSGNIV